MSTTASFSTGKPLQHVVSSQKRGESVGIYSVCSAHPEVLRAAMHSKVHHPCFLLLESTCNQVNQDGGYTGMQPHDFVLYIQALAREMDFPTNRIILGGDHLGPNPWKTAKASLAMQKAGELIQAYVRAGYTKIHIDASMPCADEEVLSPRTIAERSAVLCRLAEEAALQTGLDPPVYVIGTEVPAPGGLTNGAKQVVHVTSVESARETIRLHQAAFTKAGLSAALERVIALVVSPGVEFSDAEVFFYQPEKAVDLIAFIQKNPTMVFEAHSTDYQPRSLLKQMVEDQFAILKVGPALTFALREAVFCLNDIMQELLPTGSECTHSIKQVLLDCMRSAPRYWKEHYGGNKTQVEFALRYSFSDRMRYYWSMEPVQQAYQVLLQNLSSKSIPLALISQYFPHLVPEVKEGQLSPYAKSLIIAHINTVLGDYEFACGCARRDER